MYIFAILAASYCKGQIFQQTPVHLQLSVWAPQKMYPIVKQMDSLLVNFYLLYVGKH